MPSTDSQVRVAITAQDEATAAIRKIGEELKSLGETGAQVSQWMAGLAAGIISPAAVTGVLAGLGDLAKQAAEVGEKMARTSEITGMSAESLSGMRAIAAQTGESFDTLSGTVTRFGKNLETAFTNAKSGPGKVLGSLFSADEISALKMEPLAQQLETVSKKIFDLTDSAERDYAAAALFGRGWSENAETLRRFGQEGDAAAQKMARVAGIMITSEDAQAAKMFSEAWKNTELSLEGIKQAAGMVVIDSFVKAAPGLMNAAEQLDRLEKYRGINVQGENPDAQGALANAGLSDLGLHVLDAHKGLSDALSTQGESHYSAAKAAGENKAALADARTEQEQYNRDLAEYQRLMQALQPELDPWNKAWQEYADTLDRIQKLSGAGFDTKPLEDLAKAKAAGDMDKALGPSMDRIGMVGNATLARSAGMDQMGQITVASAGLKQTHDQFATLNADAYNLGAQMSSAFTKMVILGRGFQDSLKSLVDLFAEFILKTYVFSSIAQAFMGGKSGSNSALGTLGTFFAGLAGGRASGGDVSYGQSYAVGENGPEIFTPNVNGAITPNSPVGGGGVTHNWNIDARGADAGVEYRVQRAIKSAMQQATVGGYQMTREMSLRGAQ